MSKIDFSHDTNIYVRAFDGVKTHAIECPVGSGKLININGETYYQIYALILSISLN